MDEENRKKKDAFMLRFPEGWKAALKIAAARNRRSLTEEILFRLSPTVEPEVLAERQAEEEAAQK